MLNLFNKQRSSSQCNCNSVIEYAQKSEHDNNYKSFFENRDSIRPSTIAKIASWLIFLVIILIFSRYVDISFSGNNYISFSKNAKASIIISDVCYAASAITLSILTSVIAVMLLNQDNMRRNQAIKSLGHRDLLEAIFSILSSFGKNYKHDQIIQITLLPIEGQNEFILLSASISSYTSLKDETIKFKFNRFTSNEAAKDNKNIGLFEYEFIFNLDETSLAEIAGGQDELSKYYSIHSVALNNDNDALKAVEDETEAGKQYCYRLRNRLELNEKYKFEYTMTMPVLLRSYIYFTALFPTKSFHVKFDYSLVKDKIHVYCTDLLNSTSVIQGSPMPQGHIFEIRHPGWVIPKSSVVFVWYDRRQKSVTQSTPIKTD